MNKNVSERENMNVNEGACKGKSESERESERTQHKDERVNKSERECKNKSESERQRTREVQWVWVCVREAVYIVFFLLFSITSFFCNYSLTTTPPHSWGLYISL